MFWSGVIVDLCQMFDKWWNLRTWSQCMGACNLKVILLNCWHTVDISKTHFPFLDTGITNLFFISYLFLSSLIWDPVYVVICTMEACNKVLLLYINIITLTLVDRPHCGKSEIWHISFNRIRWHTASIINTSYPQGWVIITQITYFYQIE